MDLECPFKLSEAKTNPPRTARNRNSSKEDAANSRLAAPRGTETYSGPGSQEVALASPLALEAVQFLANHVGMFRMCKC